MTVEENGVTEASPTPTTQPDSSAVTEKTDYGMGPESSSEGSTSSSPEGDIDDETFFKTHGDRMFRHPRVKEALGWKKKYETVQPLSQLAEQAGGAEVLTELNRYFGPVFKHLVESPNGNETWQKLAPILHKVLNNEDFTVAEAQQAVEEAVEDNDPRYSDLERKYQSLESKLTEKETRELQQTRVNNIQKYEGMLHAKFTEQGLPDSLKKWASKLIIQDIGKFMPKAANGQALNPLDHVSQQVFDAVWDNVVMASIKDFEGYSKGKLIKKTDPSIPDTNGGEPPSPKQPMSSDRSAKALKMQAFFKSGKM